MRSWDGRSGVAAVGLAAPNLGFPTTVPTPWHICALTVGDLDGHPHESKVCSILLGIALHELGTLWAGADPRNALLRTSELLVIDLFPAILTGLFIPGPASPIVRRSPHTVCGGTQAFAPVSGPRTRRRLSMAVRGRPRCGLHRRRHDRVQSRDGNSRHRSALIRSSS